VKGAFFKDWRADTQVCPYVIVYTHFRTVEQAEEAFPVVDYFDFVDSCVKHNLYIKRGVKKTLKAISFGDSHPLLFKCK
jgi:hypothetical protein